MFELITDVTGRELSTLSFIVERESDDKVKGKHIVSSWRIDNLHFEIFKVIDGLEVLSRVDEKRLVCLWEKKNV